MDDSTDLAGGESVSSTASTILSDNTSQSTSSGHGAGNGSLDSAVKRGKSMPSTAPQSNRLNGDSSSTVAKATNSSGIHRALSTTPKSLPNEHECPGGVADHVKALEGAEMLIKVASSVNLVPRASESADVTMTVKSRGASSLKRKFQNADST